MKTRTNYAITSQPAVHDYVEQKYLTPWFAKYYDDANLTIEPYPDDEAKHADRLIQGLTYKAVIERKHDSSPKSDDFTFELIVNNPCHYWEHFPYRCRRNTDPNHKKYVKEIDKYVTDYRSTHDGRENKYDKMGLITSELFGLNTHWTLAVRHYRNTNITLAFLLRTKEFQREVIRMIMNNEVDIGRNSPDKYDQNYVNVLCWVDLRSLRKGMAAQWDISKEYKMLVDKKEIPSDFQIDKY